MELRNFFDAHNEYELAKIGITDVDTLKKMPYLEFCKKYIWLTSTEDLLIQ